MNAAIIQTPITTREAAYLKHCGRINDVKVTIRVVEGFPMIFIRDVEHRSFKTALLHVQRIVENEIVNLEVRS